MTRRFFLVLLAVVISSLSLEAGSAPFRAKRGMVVSQSDIASQIGFQVIRDGGNAVDAAVATAFALAVTHPTAGNIGGGGFLVFRPATGEATTFDFREAAPAGSNPEMWLVNGKYDSQLHHNSHRAVGVPGTVAGFHLAWKTLGSKPWKDLVTPAVEARARRLRTQRCAGALARADARRTSRSTRRRSRSSRRTACPIRPARSSSSPTWRARWSASPNQGPAGFYEGETAMLLEKEMKANGGLITREDLKNYQAKQRAPIKGTYRGYDIIGMAPPSSGGISVQLMLNILEAYDLKANGYGSAQNLHLIAESMRRAFAERAQHLGDPDFVKTMPIDRLISKEYAARAAQDDQPDAGVEVVADDLHLGDRVGRDHALLDRRRAAQRRRRDLHARSRLRLEDRRARRRLPAEQRDGRLQRRPGADQRDRPDRHRAQPRASRASACCRACRRRSSPRTASSFMVTGSPGGRTIINTVLLTILNVIDFGMNAQEAVDAGRIHHQWLPDRISYEEFGFSADTIAALKNMGHTAAAGRQSGRGAGHRLQREGRHARRRPRSARRRRRRGGQVVRYRVYEVRGFRGRSRGPRDRGLRRPATRVSAIGYVRFVGVHVFEAEPPLHAQVAAA